MSRIAAFGRAVAEAAASALRATPASADAPTAERIARLFEDEARRGAGARRRGRAVALGMAAALVTLLEPWPGSLPFYGYLAVFWLLGRAAAHLETRGATSPERPYLFATADCALLVVALLAPNPLTTTPYPPQMELRFPNDIYLLLPVIAPAFTFEPRLVLWNGFALGLFWAIGVAWLAALPGTITATPADGLWAAPGSPVLAPTFVHVSGLANDLVVFLVVAALLAVAVARMRRLAWRAAELERGRANLARFFPPTVADRLAALDGAIGVAREGPAAVMFVDAVGFTAWAEARPPAEAIAGLRTLLGRLEAAVFAAGGAVEKFTGDGLMATFGALEPGPRDATAALGCALAILDDHAAATEAATFGLSIGVHHGALVVGDVGSDRRLELTVIGDVVNVASRLEQLTRSLGRALVAGDALIEAVRREGAPEAAALLARLEPAGAHALKGRRAEVVLWTLRESG